MFGVLDDGQNPVIQSVSFVADQDTTAVKGCHGGCRLPLQ